MGSDTNLIRRRIRQRIDRWYVIGQVGWKTIPIGAALLISLVLLGSFSVTRPIWTGIAVILGGYFFVDFWMNVVLKVEKDDVPDATPQATVPLFGIGKVSDDWAMILFFASIPVTAIGGEEFIQFVESADRGFDLSLTSIFWSAIIFGFLMDGFLQLYGERITLRRTNQERIEPRHSEEF